MKVMRIFLLFVLFASFPGAVALSGAVNLRAGDMAGQSGTGYYGVIPVNGVVKGKARTITPGETRKVLKRYHSIPGNGAVKGKARAITPGEARKVLKHYHSIPGNGAVKGKARAITPGEARKVLKRYRSVPGGVLLEGRATGLPRFKTARYDSAANAFVLDEAIVYASPIEPSSAALLARAIAEDDRLGVSLGEDVQIVYGRLPKNTDPAIDLQIADNFLGDIILPPQEWTIGYKFANGFEPNRNVHKNTAVFFRFSDFQFARRDGKLELISANFDARLVPVLKAPAGDGGYLPDFKAIESGKIPESYLANAVHVGENINYYLQEDVVRNTFAYGEAAAFLRALKAAKIDLRRLSRSIEASLATAPTRRFSGTTLEDNWLEYLRGIQARNRYGNWSGPPADLYSSRITTADRPNQ